ncbi:TIR domain-containing protein [Amphibacillus cookii]|uniref:TIR domain-containing protein n=1 Tax=Amphibacillus cookii TaxID=767787 RepID=UPI0019576B86
MIIHDINNALDTSTEETIKRTLRERMSNSKFFILLVGEHTKYLYRFVRWEIFL